MKRKAHKLKKVSKHPTSTGGPFPRSLRYYQSHWQRCDSMKCPWHHPNNACASNPGPPGIAQPKMSRTRPVRAQ